MKSSVIAILALTACAGGSDNPTVECKETADCNLSAGGTCMAYGPTGNKWCAYPEGSCPSGYKWSTYGTGDGVAGACVPDTTPDAAPSMPTLTVLVGGNGTGHVTSTPSGIDCPGTCTAQFTSGQNVMLTATPSSSVFLGWASPCSGTGDCSVTLNADVTMSALFGIPGSNIWLDQTSATMYGTISGAAFFSNGDVAVSGYYKGSGSLGGMSLPASSQNSGFVARLKATDGTAEWITVIPANVDGPASGDSVDVDANGDVVATGGFSGTEHMAGADHTSAGGTDSFVIKLLGANGTYAWANTYGSTWDDDPHKIKADANGNLLVAGNFGADMTVGTQALTNKGSTDIIVVKYSSAGAFVWARSIGGTGLDDPEDVSADGNGNVIVSGDFQTTVDFGAGAVSSAGQTDCFVAKYSASNGSYLVAKTVGNTNDDSYCHSAADSAGDMYLTGAYSGTLNVGGATPLVSVGTATDIFLVKYSIAGAHLWSKTFGNDKFDYVDSARLDASGDLFLTGRFNDSLSFGGPTLSSAGMSDIFVAHLAAANGAHLASLRLGGAGFENAHVSMGATSRQVFVGGFFQGFSEFGGQAITAPVGGNVDGFALLMMPLD